MFGLIEHLHTLWGPSTLDRQLHLAEVVSALDWNFDLGSGVLSFGSRCWGTQVLGSESNLSQTWLWAWANEASTIPDHLLHSSRMMKALGDFHQIPELTEPEVPLDRLDGHTASLIATGVCQADAYYRCPYHGGALFVLIQDETFPRCTDPPLARIATVFPRAISALDLADHRLALAGYLRSYGLPFEEASDRILVRDQGEPVLTATFDDLNRLTNLEATLKPSR